MSQCRNYIPLNMKKIFILLSAISLFLISVAAETSKTELCPIKRFVEQSTPTQFADKFQGDTITFSIPDAENAYFEVFKFLVPDTLWLKERPLNKPPQEHKHFKLINNFKPVPGWGVNAHRQYTRGTSLDGKPFILRGSHTETVQYLGTFNYVLLEDVATGKIIKWDYTKNENKGIVIFSPSIMRHLNLMKGLDFIIEENDSTFIPAKCTDVAFSIGVKPKVWGITLDVDFRTNKGKVSSHNWQPKFFLKKDEDKLIQSQQ